MKIRSLARITLIIIGLSMCFALLADYYTWRKAHSSAAYWKLLDGDYCSANSSAFALERLYESGQNLNNLRLGCPQQGIRLSHVDLSPHLSFKHFYLSFRNLFIFREHSELWPYLNRFFFDIPGAYIQRSEFSNARFDYANLNKVRAYRSNFTGADFSFSEMRESSFFYAILDETKMILVRANDANFNRASMVGADLSSGIFIGASFHRANLRDANFTDAILKDAEFSYADLSGATFEGAEDLTCEQLKAAKNPDEDLLAEVCEL